jgi:hypothetical protein
MSSAQLPPTVTRLLDPATGCFYLVHASTGLTTWDTPEARQALQHHATAENFSDLDQGEDEPASVLAPEHVYESDDQVLSPAGTPQLPRYSPEVLPHSLPSSPTEWSAAKRYGSGVRVAYSGAPAAKAEDPRSERVAQVVLASQKLRLAFIHSATKRRLCAHLDALRVVYGEQDEYEALLALLISSLASLARQISRSEFAVILSRMLENHDFLVETLVFPEAAQALPLLEDGSSWSPPQRDPPPPLFANAGSPHVEPQAFSARIRQPPAEPASPLAASPSPPTAPVPESRWDPAPPHPPTERWDPAPPHPPSDQHPEDDFASSLREIHGNLDRLIESVKKSDGIALIDQPGSLLSKPGSRATAPAATDPRAHQQVPFAAKPSAACGAPSSCSLM